MDDQKSYCLVTVSDLEDLHQDFLVEGDSFEVNTQIYTGLNSMSELFLCLSDSATKTTTYLAPGLISSVCVSPFTPEEAKEYLRVLSNASE